MQKKPLYSFFLIFGCCVRASSPWAEEFTTTDGRSFVMDSPVTGLPEDVTASGVPDDAVPAFSKEPVILNFDDVPRAPWEAYSCSGHTVTKASHGILTVRSPNDCKEFILNHKDDPWHKYVDFNRGWIIETSLQVDPSTDPECGDGAASVQIWAHDHRKLVIIGFSTNEICIAYPDTVRVPMDTTDSFHVYRIESQGRLVQVFVDGKRKINHRVSVNGGGSDILSFGDGVVDTSSLTRWDYFSYDVFP